MFVVLNDVLGYENLIDLIGIALVMSCFEYQCYVPRKSCIRALNSKIPLSDIVMDNLRARSSDLGVNCIDILELMNSECHSGASQVKF